MRCEIHDVHLWRARTQELAADAGELAATLSPDEQQRAQGFALRKDREAFILRRGLLRLRINGLQQSPAPGAVVDRLGDRKARAAMRLKTGELG